MNAVYPSYQLLSKLQDILEPPLPADSDFAWILWLILSIVLCLAAVAVMRSRLSLRGRLQAIRSACQRNRLSPRDTAHAVAHVIAKCSRARGTFFRRLSAVDKDAIAQLREQAQRLRFQARDPSSVEIQGVITHALDLYAEPGRNRHAGSA